MSAQQAGRRWTVCICSCGYRGDAQGHTCLNGDEPHFALAEYVDVVPAAELAEANEALREVTRLSGADLSDGFPTWPPLHEFAVQEVKRLREDADEEAALSAPTTQEEQR